jgi:8-oxo-dGTP pyrophosphatase MutT (NUDIX family)
MKKSQSAGGVVLNSRGEIAIVNQKHRSWSLPKGHVEEDEDFLEAAKREILEETGITDLKLITFLGSYSRFALDYNNEDNPKEYKTMHFYLFSTTQNELAPSDTDNPEARWVSTDEVENYLTHPEDKKFIKEVIENHLSGSKE